MGDTVFVNGMSVLHRGSSGKSMAATPDVCLCPPPAPTGPVPTPLPNSSLASNLDGGARSVLIENNPAGTRDSFLTTSTGNELARPTGGGVVSHATKGKTYFVMGSMDVLFEGKAAVRHLDTGTHNHGSPANTPPWPTVAADSFDKEKGPCSGQADRCKLVPYKPGCPAKPEPKKTPHHVVPAHCFLKENSEIAAIARKFRDKRDKLPNARSINEVDRKLGRRRGVAYFKEGKPHKLNGEAISDAEIEATCRDQCKQYRSSDAPCICVSGQNDTEGDHGRIHRRADLLEALAAQKNKGEWTYAQASTAGCKSAAMVTDCSAACLQAQVDAYHVDACRINKKTPLRADTGGVSVDKARRVLREIAKLARLAAKATANAST